MRIRRASEGDAADVARVISESFAEFQRLYTHEGYAATTPAAEVLRARLSEGPTWVVEDDRSVLATVSAVERDGAVYVRSMAVIPAARGRGVASQLMRELVAFARSRNATRLYLSTTPFLFDAIRLYESLGFRRSGEPPHDLHGTPLVTMSRPLAP